ncbi:MAG: hemolysin family protein [Bacteroidia bacterium]|nr:hemolysin family protein [Bacteroidia bacterium]
MDILIILGLILFNGLLSMSEMSIVSARKSRLELEAKKGNKSAKKALDLSNNPDNFFSTIQIGITLIGIVTGLFSGEAFAADLAKLLEKIPLIAPYAYGVSETIIVIVVTYLTLILGELVPKRLGLVKAEGIAKTIAQPMLMLAKITYPLVWLLSKSTGAIIKVLGLDKSTDNKVTEEEVKAVMKESLDDGEIEEVEHDIVERVFNLGDRTVSSIMTHRKEMVWLDINESAENLKLKVKENVFNTYPVVDGDIDKILGVVHLKNIFEVADSNDFKIKDILKEAFYVPEDMCVYDALEKFKEARMKSAIVTDEFGGVMGIVTIKDILEALVGVMPEESDSDDWLVREDGTILVDGQYSFYDFLEYFDMEDFYQENDYNTISGLIIALRNEIPHIGEKIEWNKFTFEIVDMDGARIDKVLVHVNNED